MLSSPLFSEIIDWRRKWWGQQQHRTFYFRSSARGRSNKIYLIFIWIPFDFKLTADDEDWILNLLQFKSRIAFDNLDFKFFWMKKYHRFSSVITNWIFFFFFFWLVYLVYKKHSFIFRVDIQFKMSRPYHFYKVKKRKEKIVSIFFLFFF